MHIKFFGSKGAIRFLLEAVNKHCQSCTARQAVRIGFGPVLIGPLTTLIIPTVEMRVTADAPHLNFLVAQRQVSRELLDV